MTLLSQKISLPAGHEKTAQTLGELPVPAITDPVNVSLISKSIKSVPASEKTPGTMYNGFSYASSLAAGDIAYIQTAFAMALRARYRAEANSHKNMKQRAKEHGKIVSSAIFDFRDFLLLIAPMPAPGMTLDRIDNGDPSTRPVRSAGRRRRSRTTTRHTRVYTLSANGMKFTASQLAEHFGLTTDAIRKRSERGWTDDEIIEGKRHREAVAVSSPAKTKAAAPRTPMTGRERELKLLRRIENTRSAKEKAYLEMALLYEQHRRMDGEEAFPAPLEVLNEGLSPDHGWCIPPEKYERKLCKFWPEHRPHVDFDKLPASRKKLSLALTQITLPAEPKKLNAGRR